MPQKKLMLVPPMGGYAEVNAYSEQPAGTTPNIRNVMVLDASTSRFRLAQRAGVGKYNGFDYTLGVEYTAGTVQVPAAGGHVIYIFYGFFTFTVTVLPAWLSTLYSNASPSVPGTHAAGDPCTSGGVRDMPLEITAQANNTGITRTGSIGIVGVGFDGLSRTIGLPYSQPSL